MQNYLLVISDHNPIDIFFFALLNLLNWRKFNVNPNEVQKKKCIRKLQKYVFFPISRSYMMDCLIYNANPL